MGKPSWQLLSKQEALVFITDQYCKVAQCQNIALS